MSDTVSTTRPLYGQVAIVTGGARGIGRQVALSLAKAGASVVVNFLTSTEEATHTVELCLRTGSRALSVQADVSSEDEVQGLFLKAQALGEVSILVNNAGRAQSRLVIDASVDDWDAMMRANLTNAFLCTRAALPGMIQRRYGRIINISSVYGLSGGSGEALYSAAKGGLIAFTKAVAKEVAKTGITVNAVAPGAIDTDMLKDLTLDDRQHLENEIPVGRIGHADDVAQAVVYLASPHASYTTGQVISPNGGWWT